MKFLLLQFYRSFMKELEELVLKKQSTLTIYKNYPKNKEIPLLQSKGIEGA